MRTTLSLILLPAAIVLSSCKPEDPLTNGTGGNAITYVGTINGARATARVSFEPLPHYTIMAGDITSSQFYYTFSADIVGNSGYGDMLLHADNSRFLARFDVSGNGFTLTSNPFGPGNPTSYDFVRQ